MVTHAEAAKKAATRGGFREGGGRKPRIGLPEYEAREKFNRKVDEHWDEIMGHLVRLLKEGDKDMLKAVLEQRIGKAPQALTIDGNLKQQLNINFLIHDGGRYKPSSAPLEAGRDSIPPGKIQGDGRGEEIWQNRRLA